MAFTVISSGTTTQNVGNTDFFTLTAGGTLSSSSDAIFFIDASYTAATVNILGSVIAANIGVNAFALLDDVGGANNITVRVGKDGSVLADAFGVAFQDGDGNKVLNEGTIHGTTSGVFFDGGSTNAYVENHGHIAGVTGNGIFANGSGTHILNSGAISGDGEVATSAAVYVSNSVLDNSGTLSSEGGQTVVFVSGTNVFTNSGTVLGDVVYQAGMGRLANSGSGVITGQVEIVGGGGDRITNAGLIGNGVQLGATAFGSTLSNSGRIESTAYGIQLLPGADSVTLGNDGVIAAPSTGILSDGLNTSVTNTGKIDLGRLGYAVYLANSGATLINSGTLTAEYAVTFLAPGRVINSGEIHGALSGLQLFSYINPSPAMVINNTGTISGGSRAAVDSFVDALTPLVVRNTGTLTSDQSAAVSNFYDSALSLFNSGVIIGGAGVALTTGATKVDRVTNLGSIEGNVLLAGGNDVMVNGGTVIGEVNLGADNDLFRATGDGVVTGRVIGEIGNDSLIGANGDDNFAGFAGEDLLVGHGGDDTLFGGVNNDTLIGGAGNDSLISGTQDDVLNGQDGDDTLLGDGGNDAMTGGAGSDAMFGGADNDTLNGQDGEDLLEGEAGNDILRGGNGDDALAGGEGFDLLTGGQGADSFVFRSFLDTAVGATRDQILDFEQGADIIVVAGLHPGVFEFRGTSAFAPSGNPELRLFETATGSTIVQFDLDGNGTVDAEIRVANVIGLTATDFVL
ncbi:calcium-binding protein [Maliponia aquimaris]|uniref:Hemolysin, plasmid n=1 Tax=Maliponia aquimaris TaxID=1673631 RepID=A0A238KSH9_9RHOB|nr:calcium-binding protein [Maliponia aquimaris]SMX45610.1 Hemolysin, plasmid [Maliponia aquimaris]